MVPNAPCGVESPPLSDTFGFLKRLFLMHRVELKGPYQIFLYSQDVEFLMHRVELKVKNRLKSSSQSSPFLMHRVELKGDGKK